MKNSFLFCVVLLMIGILSLISCQGKKSDAIPKKQPNIVFILADDLGYGDLGFLGQKVIETPNLDRLAAEGMFFSNHYSGATVCAPSRSALMTGLHTGHTPIRGNFEIQPEGQYPLSDTLLTLPKLFQRAGYATGAFGKWGLGFVGTEGDPNNQGFDQFFGYNCQRIAHRYYPEYLWKNKEKVFLPGNDWKQKSTYAPDIIHQESLKFLEENSHKPFFMFVPMVMPHAELAIPEGDLLDYYRNKIGDEEPHLAKKGSDYGDDPFDIPGYQSNPYPRASYAAMVALLDRQVGEIIKKLEDLGLIDNTIIIFASDNGPHVEGGNDPDYFDSNGIFRGYKRDLYEGGIKTPLIVKWPGIIKKGSTSEHISAFWDFLPTFAEIIGQEVPQTVDGISFLPTLKGESNQRTHEYLYWEFHELGGRQAIRKGDWKAVKYGVKNNPQAAMELYNLKEDPSESQNIADRYPDIAQEMTGLFNQARIPNPIFKFFE
ncbi:arylsulfatase [Cecembia calidifontis]|uniref:Arylsulfatase A-like enzyme n=1 Tax=Cecembia calidifontis TaxID=1187080 RepID=A0A4Q7P9E8_9BACT|nr:arylsulfatase [Cecembia calidifontis]RZS96537.1 arylsulfatase A-like enzyme [Cecembia calidifontis]